MYTDFTTKWSQRKVESKFKCTAGLLSIFTTAGEASSIFVFGSLTSGPSSCGQRPDVERVRFINQTQTCVNFHVWWRPSQVHQVVMGVPGVGSPWPKRSMFWCVKGTKILNVLGSLSARQMCHSKGVEEDTSFVPSAAVPLTERKRPVEPDLKVHAFPVHAIVHCWFVPPLAGHPMTVVLSNAERSMTVLDFTFWMT